MTTPNKEKLLKKYLPMSEGMFLILFALQEPLHGYGIMLKIKEMTNNRTIIGNGMLYGTLGKMTNDGLLVPKEDDNLKKCYFITELGTELLAAEEARIEALYQIIHKEDVKNDSN